MKQKYKKLHSKLWSSLPIYFACANKFARTATKGEGFSAPPLWIPQAVRFRSKLRSFIYKLALVIVGLFLLISLSIYDLYVHDFHTVIPYQVYRSAQLSKAQFKAVIQAHKIKSILNLRGANPGNDWYTNELVISEQMHINHYDIPLDSDLLPSTANFKKLVNILQTAPRPILIHCESGVDRSGLAAAVSLILLNKPWEIIKKQVSWTYFVLSDDSVGRQFLAIYKEWLDKNRLTTSRQNFLRWLAQYTHSN